VIAERKEFLIKIQKITAHKKQAMSQFICDTRPETEPLIPSI